MKKRRNEEMKEWKIYKHAFWGWEVFHLHHMGGDYWVPLGDTSGVCRRCDRKAPKALLVAKSLMRMKK
jgi:hypothetical protein